MTQTAPILNQDSPPSSHTHLRLTLFIEAILSFACSFLFIGIFYYTAEILHWNLVRNFLLAAGQGAVYVFSALSSQKVAKALGRRRLLIWSHIVLAGISLAGVLASD